MDYAYHNRLVVGLVLILFLLFFDMFLTNKHVVIALIVAPILAIGSYYITDYLVSEAPKKAQQGQSYKLVAKPNCRYGSGECELHNGDFSVTLVGKKQTSQGMQLVLDANFPLQGVTLALAKVVQRNGKWQPIFAAPQNMQPANTNNTQWVVVFPDFDIEKGWVRLALSAQNKSKYFAEFPTIFIRNTVTYQYTR